MNIVEAYLKFNKQLIILISGLSGSNKSQLAKFIERDFKLKAINTNDYSIKDFEKMVEVIDGVKINDWDDIDSVDWLNINKDVEKYKEKGVVLYGSYITSDKITFNPDFHIHVKISKQNLIDARRTFIKNNPDKCKELIRFVDTPTEHAIINRIVFPHYQKYLEQSKIDKYINANELGIDEVYDAASNFLFNKINERLKTFVKQPNAKEIINSSVDKTDDDKTDDDKIDIDEMSIETDTETDTQTDSDIDDSDDSTDTDKK
jgi:uridine kinase